MVWFLVRLSYVIAVATYAIGDIQGCYESLRALLQKIDYNARHDSLILLGDLVNRGPRSLDVLRWAYQQQARVHVILGNHDLHLLGRFFGVRKARKRDTLDEILAAPDCTELMSWLRQQPLFLQHNDCLFVHAGLLPQWTCDEFKGLARRAQHLLMSEDAASFVHELAKVREARWQSGLTPFTETAIATAVATRVRFVLRDGSAPLSFASTLDEAPRGYVPWFEHPQRKSAGTHIVFGHWAHLGLHRAPNITALDTGCVWGASLTALRLDDDSLFSVPAVESAQRY